MEWNWLSSLIYGFLSGFTGILPVSAEAHQTVFEQLLGLGGRTGGFRLACHAATLLAVLLACRPQLHRFRREQRIAAVPYRKRKRQPDFTTLMDVRFYRTAVISAVLLTLLRLFTQGFSQRLWLLALLVALNALILYIPQHMQRANKDARSLSRLDALLVGAGSALTVLPGCSGVGCSLSVGSMRGMDRQYAVNVSLLLCIAVLPVMIGAELYGVIALGAAAVSAGWIILYILAAAAAFFGAYLGIKLVRFLAVNAGFSGFAYYCWGLALFIFALYLVI